MLTYLNLGLHTELYLGEIKSNKSQSEPILACAKLITITAEMFEGVDDGERTYVHF